MEEVKQENCCLKYSLGKYLLVVLSILVLGAVVVISLIRERIVNPYLNQVSVTAEGLAMVTPDLAKVAIAVKTDKIAEAAKGVQQNTERMNKVIAEIKKLGIEEKDLSSTNYTLYPNYEYPGTTGERVLRGYDVYQELLVKVRDLSKVSQVVSAATTAGANQINSISFLIEDEEAAKQQAREDAVTKAKVKAQDLAKLTGIKLGKLINVYENVVYLPDGKSYGYSGEMGGYGGGSASPDLQPGESEVRLEITLVYKIK